MVKKKKKSKFSMRGLKHPMGLGCRKYSGWQGLPWLTWSTEVEKEEGAVPWRQVGQRPALFSIFPRNIADWVIGTGTQTGWKCPGYFYKSEGKFEALPSTGLERAGLDLRWLRVALAVKSEDLSSIPQSPHGVRKKPVPIQAVWRACSHRHNK